MTLDEFKLWLDEHTLAFPIVARNFREAQGGARERVWFTALKDINARDAKAASEAMLADEDLQPSRLEQHPARVRKLAGKAATDRKRREITARYGEGTRAGCPACQGDQWVYVTPWNEESTLAAASESPPEHGLVLIVCQCTTDPQWRYPYRAEKHGPCFRHRDLWQMPDDHPARSIEALEIVRKKQETGRAMRTPKDFKVHGGLQAERDAKAKAIVARGLSRVSPEIAAPYLKRWGLSKADVAKAKQKPGTSGVVADLGRSLSPDAERRKRWRQGTKVGGTTNA